MNFCGESSSAKIYEQPCTVLKPFAISIAHRLQKMNEKSINRANK